MRARGDSSPVAGRGKALADFKDLMVESIERGETSEDEAYEYVRERYADAADYERERYATWGEYVRERYSAPRKDSGQGAVSGSGDGSVGTGESRLPESGAGEAPLGDGAPTPGATF